MTIIQHQYSFQTIKAQAKGRWDSISLACGMDKKYLRKKHGPCPCCGGVDRFRFDDKNGDGTFYCNQCGSGDGFKFIQLYRRCTAGESLRLVANILNGGASIKVQAQDAKSSQPQLDKNHIEKNRQTLQRIWDGSLRIVRDAAFRYLTNIRKLELTEIPLSLRISLAMDYFADGQSLGRFPTMLARVENLAGELVSIHRTYLTVEGNKAPVPSSKKLMTPVYPGATTGAAIRLYPASETLVLSEGIETALCGALVLNLPAWACVSAHGLEKVRLPDMVRKAIILVDNDESNAGQQAAEKLKHRLIKEGRQVKQLLPPKIGTDWLDISTNNERVMAQ